MAMRRSARLSSIGLSESQDSVGYFNTRFSLNTFLKKVRRLTGDQRKAIERTGFGNLLEIPNQTLNKNLLVELMRRWDVEKHYMVLPCGEIHLTLKDVALILGLRVIGAPVLLDDNESFIDLESEFNGSVWKRNVTVASLETRLDSFGGICNDDFIRTFLLYTFGTFLFPNANDKVDTRYLTFLKNVDNIGSYAWGAAVLEHLIKWLDKRKDMDVKYVGGCLLFLQIWSFEHIDIARPALLDSSVAFPRVCQWDNAKCNNKEHLFSKFKNLEYSQVTWELQLTSWESEIDMIKELLEEQSKGKEPSEAENSSVDCPIVTDNNLETTRQLVNQVVIVVETESETSPISGRQCEQEVNLDSPTESMCEVLTDVIECCSTPTFLSKQQKRANVVARSKNSNSILIEDEEDMRTRVQMLEEQIMELEKENHKLRRENELLQIQQSSGSQLEENNNLKSEIDALRREHEILSVASNSLVDRLEKILLDENTDIDEESHPIPTQD